MDVKFNMNTKIIGSNTFNPHVSYSTSGKGIPGFLKFLCKYGYSDLISFKQFIKVSNIYKNKIGQSDVSVNIRKVFLHYLILFGINYKISKSKILNFNFNSHHSIVKQLNIIKYGLPAPRPSSVAETQCSNCSCPSDFSQSGCACACNWAGCYGWCNGDSCDDSDIPWWC
jgi:hypothetical protein